MRTATVIHLADHRISTPSPVAARAESPLAAALGAPEYAAPDFGAAVPAEAEADARRASWHYPPAAPIIDWFPPTRSLSRRIDQVMRATLLFVIAASWAMALGATVTALAGGLALIFGA